MPDLSRRAVLAASGVAAAVAALPAPAFASAARLPRRADFARLHGKRLRLTGPHGSARAVVADVADLTGTRPGDPRRYSALLRPTRPLPDGIYRLSGSR